MFHHIFQTGGRELLTQCAVECFLFNEVSDQKLDVMCHNRVLIKLLGQCLFLGNCPPIPPQA